MFSELRYIYTGTGNYEQEVQFYETILKATKIWEFEKFGAKVCAFQLAETLPLILLADHLPTNERILIYSVENLDVSIDQLKKNGLQFEGRKFGIPDGLCINFADFSGNKYAIFEQTQSEDYLKNEYAKRQIIS